MRVAVVGATGAVGQEMLAVLGRSRLAEACVLPLASARSAGTTVSYRGQPLTVRELDGAAFADVDLALFSAGGDISRTFAPQAVARGALVVDNSSAFRMQADTPLVVPEVNAAAAARHAGIIANPNCSTIILVLALAPLARAFGLADVVVATYQAVSGAGLQAIAELRAQQADPQRPAGPAFPHRIADNVIPFVDRFVPGGHTREERKLIDETRKILELPALSVRATCARVPIERAHSEAVHVTLARDVTLAEVREALAAAPGLVLEDAPESHTYPMPLRASGRDAVGVGRLRQPDDAPHQLDFWLCGDQLLKGAALNAVQIAERLLVTD